MLLERRTGLNVVLLAAIGAWGIGCATQAPPPSTPIDTPNYKFDDVGPRPPAGPEKAALPPSPLTDSAQQRARRTYVDGNRIFEQGEYDLAIGEYEKALAADPTFYKAWFMKGMCHYYRQRYDLEIDCYRRCLEIAPNYIYALENLAIAYFAKDELENAVTTYHKVLAQDPKHPVALYNLGIIYFTLGVYPLSIESFQRFVDAYPSDLSRPKAELGIKRARQRWEDTQQFPQSPPRPK